MLPWLLIAGGLGLAGVVAAMSDAQTSSVYEPIGGVPAPVGKQKESVLRWVPLVRGALAYTGAKVPIKRVLGTIHHESGGNPKAMSYYRKKSMGDPAMPKSIKQADKKTRLNWMKANWHGHAYGLGQLIPETGAKYGGIVGAGYALYPGQPGDSYDPKKNILGTVRFLEELHQKYKGDLDRMASAYYAGPGGGRHADYEANARATDAIYEGII